MNIPSLYVLGTSPSDTQKKHIRLALDITPVAGAVISNYEYLSYSLDFTSNVLFDDQSEESLISKYLSVASDLDAPIALFVSSSIPLKVVYSDSTQEEIQC